MKKIICLSLFWLCGVLALSENVEQAWWELQCQFITLEKALSIACKEGSFFDALGQFTGDAKLPDAAALETAEDIQDYLDTIKNRRIQYFLAQQFRSRARFDVPDGFKIAVDLTDRYNLEDMPMDHVSRILEELNDKRRLVDIEMKEQDPNLLGLYGKPVILAEAANCMPYGEIIKDALMRIKDDGIRKVFLKNCRTACIQNGLSKTLASLSQWHNGKYSAPLADVARLRTYTIKPANLGGMMQSAVLVVATSS